MGESLLKGPWQRLRARLFGKPVLQPKYNRLYIMCKTGHIIYAQVSPNYDLKSIGFVEVEKGEQRLNAASVNLIVVKD